MYKKIFAIFLAVFMLLSVTACGDKSDSFSNGSEQKDENKSTSSSDGFVLKNDDSVELGEPDAALDPQTVYSNLTYTPEMFYGDYRLPGGDEAEEQFGAEASYFTWVQGGNEKELSTLPFRLRTGKETMSHSINYVEDYHWMELYYMLRHGENQYSLTSVYCAYTIEGNKLILTPLDTYYVDTENNKITYTFSDVTWEYDFAFNGRTLTLSADGSSVTLITGLDAYGEEDYLYVDNYLSPESESIDGIDFLNFRYSVEDQDSRIYFDMTDGTTSYDSVGVLQENGLFTFTLSLEESVKTYQFVYFYGGRDGIVLTNGTETYFYNDTYSDRNSTVLKNYLTEDQTAKLDELSDSQIESIVEKKENLMDDLAKAFTDAGIQVTVDENTGELIMDASILFGGDSAVLSAEGKDFLNKFIAAYTSIIFSEKYEGFVSKTMVEGHTAPIANSTYETGLPLSEERAAVVKEYCLSSETGVDTGKLAETLEAIGYSNTRPVVDADGNVDLDASRRVSFRFIINLDQ